MERYFRALVSIPLRRPKSSIQSRTPELQFRLPADVHRQVRLHLITLHRGNAYIRGVDQVCYPVSGVENRVPHQKAPPNRNHPMTPKDHSKLSIAQRVPAIIAWVALWHYRRPSSAHWYHHHGVSETSVGLIAVPTLS